MLKQYLSSLEKSHLKSELSLSHLKIKWKKLFKTFYIGGGGQGSKEEQEKGEEIHHCSLHQGEKYQSLFVFGTQFMAQQSESMNLSRHGWMHQLAFESEDSIIQLSFKKHISLWHTIFPF